MIGSAFGKVGVLIGTAAGEGHAADSVSALSAWLKDSEVAFCEGRFDGDGPQGWVHLKPKDGSGDHRPYVEDLRSSVAAFAAWGVELIVCVGGDGLASYSADAMISSGRQMTLFGVPAGTINAGPIVTEGIEAVEPPSLSQLRVEQVGAVEVLVDGEHVAYGFNDVVFGDTYLGTVGGKVGNLSARALLERGEKVEAKASKDIVSKRFRIFKNSRRLRPHNLRPAQLVAAPLRRREFFARAIAGVLCNASFMEGPAALSLFDSVIVSAGPPCHGLEDFSSSEQVLFGPGDLIEIEGLAEAGLIIADGNPYTRMGGVVSLRSIPNLVDVLRVDPRLPGG